MAKRRQTIRKSPAVRKPRPVRRRASSPKREAADLDPSKEVATLRRQLGEALERQKATNDILDAINRSRFELQPVLDTIVRTASRLCDAEFALIFKRIGEEYHLAATNNAATNFVKYATTHPIRPGRGTITGRTALLQKTVHSPDCLADPEYDAFEYQKAGKYRSMLGVPLRHEGGSVGVVVLMRTVVKPFTDEQIDLVTTFANQALIAIENVRLFDGLKNCSSSRPRLGKFSRSLVAQRSTCRLCCRRWLNWPLVCVRRILRTSGVQEGPSTILQRALASLAKTKSGKRTESVWKALALNRVEDR